MIGSMAQSSVLAQCAGAQSFTVNPAPNGGGNTYLPGTVVTYCYTMNGYSQAGTNWVDGFEILLGSGWQAGSLLGTVPPGNLNGGGGQWIWSNSVTGSATGQTNGPGYFFDLNIDGNPGNDFGDAGSGVWTFCFQATVGNVPGASLSVTVNAMGDGAIGSWSNNSCPGIVFTLSTATVASSSTIVTVGPPATFCPGGNVVLTAAGATSYTWSPAAGLSATTGASVTASPGATTTYTVTGSGGCNPCTATVTVTVNPNPTVSIAPATATICAGGNIALTASGATTYSWSPATGLSATTGATVTASPAATTTYTVTGTTNGCTGTATRTVTVNPLPTVTISPAATTICAGGTIALTANGATTYSWSPGTGLSATTGATVTASPATTTTYTVTGTANGCSGTATQTVNVVSFTATASSTNSTCTASDGTVTATPNPAGAYTYSWNSAPVQNTQTATGLPPGPYTVTVTGPNGCTATANTTVTATNQVVNVPVPPTTAAICTSLNGTATANPASGTAPYTYSWNTAPVQATQTATGLASGPYTVTVTDANGCTGTANAVVALNPGNLTVSIPTVNDATCNGTCNGSLIAQPVGGTAPMNTVWNDPAAQSTLTASNLCAGNFQVIVTDANGCTANANATVAQPTVLSVNVTTTSACPGLSNGTATATPAGGTPPYNVTWGGANPAAMAAGNYTVTVTDANGCIITQNVTISNSNALGTTVTTTDVSCFGLNDGSATLTISGGTAPFNTNWNGANPNALASGNYTVTVTDQIGCSSTSNYVINEPAVLTAAATVTDVLCNGGSTGSATLNINGGTNPYAQNWAGANPAALPAGNYSPIVTDANGCTVNVNLTVNEPAALTIAVATTDATCATYTDGTAIETVNGGIGPYALNWGGQNQNAMGAGNFNVIVTDANGCTATAAFTINEPTGMSMSVTVTDVLCFGGTDGTALETILGGTAPYAVNWNGENPASLASGNYQVTATDAQGCSLTETYTVNEPNVLNAQITVTDVTCFGLSTGTAVETISGGTTPYNVNWNGANQAGLPAGNYTLDVTDANGCATSVNFTVNEPTQLTATISTTDALCFGDANGTATVQTNGGTLPHNINWNGQNANALTQGNYSAAVTDANGCAVNLPYTINEPALLTTSVQSTDATCFGYSDGTAVLTSAGGTLPYVESWAGANPLALAAGTYTGTVTDANGCIASAIASIAEPTAMTVQLATTDVLCNGNSEGTATLTIAGGTPPYAQNWGALIPTALPSGTHSVTVTDANGCAQTLNAIINEPPALLVNISTIAGAACIGQTVNMAGSVSGGIGPYATSWLAPATDQYFIPNGTDAQTIAYVNGGYTLEATDANGCYMNFTYNMPVNGPLEIIVPPISPVCPLTAANFQLSGNGGDGTYDWSWDINQNSITANIVTPLIDSALTITFVLNDNCTVLADTAVVTIVAYQAPPFNITPLDTAGCEPFLVTFSDNTVPMPVQWIWEFNDPYNPGAYYVGPNSMYVYEHSGTYQPQLTVTTVEGCEFSTSADVTVHPRPLAGFTSDPFGIAKLIDARFEFTDNSNGAVEWFWDFGDGDTSTFPDPVHIFSDTGDYHVLLAVWSDMGCVDTTQYTIKIEPDFTIYIPNSFTPNGDGINDTFGAKGMNVQSFYMTIHDRWGEQLFEIFDINKGWDGIYMDKPVEQGIYGWSATVVELNGKSHDLIGSVRLIR